MLISELINKGSKFLKNNDISSYLIDAELILSKSLDISREKFLSLDDTRVEDKIILNFNKLIARRVKKEPIAYIFEKKEFWSLDFIVNKDTLIPRPETELLIECVVKYYKNKKIFILDIGTGSGCIILSILKELKKSKGIGIDVSKKAIKVASKNAKNLGLQTRSKFIKRNLNEFNSYMFDLIVSNPPYICSHELKNLSEDIKKYEPRLALDGGNDGLDVVKKIIYKSKSILKRKGMLALEIGYGQFKKVSPILKFNGFKIKFIIKDYHNNIRCILAVLEH
ncbi:peptide chain release factor N(5)-glutamine methyltransferase [Pelagibacteraceae bacterium]|nr:peptide chain release factor N(5)-glutamine methyltransferase [Pelagibacteraceae bacterium]